MREREREREREEKIETVRHIDMEKGRERV